MQHRPASAVLSRIVTRWNLAVMALSGLAAVALLWPLPAPWVEELYAARLYPALQRSLTGLSNSTSVAWLDVVVLGVALHASVALWRVVRPAGQGRATVLRGLLVTTAGLAAAGYLVFLACWGLHYERAPLSSRLDFDRDRVTPEALEGFAERAIGELTRLVPRTSDAVRGRSGVTTIEAELRPAFDRALTDLDLPSIRHARVKVPVLARYFDAAGISGMTNPFGLETLVASNLLPAEQPLVIAHEWAHLAGIAAESDATMVGWLACLHGTDRLQYSAWLDMGVRVLGELPADRRRQGLSRLPASVLQEFRERAARSERDQIRWVGEVAWSVYDRYLQAHRVVGGIRSYDASLTLLLGTRFYDGWRPTRRTHGHTQSQRIPGT